MRTQNFWTGLNEVIRKCLKPDIQYTVLYGIVTYDLFFCVGRFHAGRFQCTTPTWAAILDSSRSHAKNSSSILRARSGPYKYLSLIAEAFILEIILRIIGEEENPAAVFKLSFLNFSCKHIASYFEARARLPLIVDWRYTDFLSEKCSESFSFR